MEVPTVFLRPMIQGYVRGYTPKIWPYMVQYFHFRILEFPLISNGWWLGVPPWLRKPPSGAKTIFKLRLIRLTASQQLLRSRSSVWGPGWRRFRVAIHAFLLGVPGVLKRTGRIFSKAKDEDLMCLEWVNMGPSSDLPEHLRILQDFQPVLPQLQCTMPCDAPWPPCCWSHPLGWRESPELWTFCSSASRHQFCRHQMSPAVSAGQHGSP